MFDILYAVDLDSDHMGHDEDHDRHGDRRVEVGRRRFEPGDEAQKIQAEDVEPKRRDEREELPSHRSHRFNHQAVETTDDDLHDILEPAGKDAHPAGGQVGKEGERRHDEPCIRYDNEVMFLQPVAFEE